jgi:hypothetical protein
MAADDKRGALKNRICEAAEIEITPEMIEAGVDYASDALQYYPIALLSGNFVDGGGQVTGRE